MLSHRFLIVVYGVARAAGCSQKLHMSRWHNAANYYAKVRIGSACAKSQRAIDHKDTTSIRMA